MEASTPVSGSTPARRRKFWLRKTLRASQQEAVASATMTATGDNFFNAFAIYLHATAVQMGWLTALPQLFGAGFQLISAWLSNYVPRRPFVVAITIVQTLVVIGLSTLAILHPTNAVNWLIVLAVFYFACNNLIQPQWRAWMGSIVPQRRRGAFFASRTRWGMIASLLVFLGGGAVLSLTEKYEVVWIGFAVLFGTAAIGRSVSSALMWRMHDPDSHPQPSERKQFSHSFQQMARSLHDRTFRNYSLFVACMQGVVAISAPFFAVYMLRDLKFTYLEYSINSIASIAIQLLTLNFWGRCCDRFGNRWVMVISSSIIPIVPWIWMVSPNFYYLLLVQMVSGFAWSAFTLSTANYLYDIRPHKTDFAIYAAMQSGLSAVGVFSGAMVGGWLALWAPRIVEQLPWLEVLRSPLYIVFATTAILRATASLWFLPRLTEPHIRRRPQLLQIVYRVSRFNAISGVALDWLTITKKKRNDEQVSP